MVRRGLSFNSKVLQELDFLKARYFFIDLGILDFVVPWIFRNRKKVKTFFFSCFDYLKTQLLEPISRRGQVLHTPRTNQKPTLRVRRLKDNLFLAEDKYPFFERTMRNKSTISFFFTEFVLFASICSVFVLRWLKELRFQVVEARKEDFSLFSDF